MNISEECREKVLATDVTAYDIFDDARAEVLAVMEVRQSIYTGTQYIVVPNRCCWHSSYWYTVDAVGTISTGTQQLLVAQLILVHSRYWSTVDSGTQSSSTVDTGAH